MNDLDIGTATIDPTIQKKEEHLFPDCSGLGVTETVESKIVAKERDYVYIIYILYYIIHNIICLLVMFIIYCLPNLARA